MLTTRMPGRVPGIWFVLCISVLLLGCAVAPQPQRVQPVQSPNDENAYRLVTLQNGLQALLISDTDAPKAAASLDVMVGSGDNPPGRGGLAHFLEHMLFLGTEKYPDAAEYERFVTEHGGSRNAYTSNEHTNYFFDIDSEHLAGALDRFAQFFISPSFDADYVEREKNAVQAEYQMGLKSDARRGLDVLQEVMNPQHPYSQFSVGSLESLADRPGDSVRDDLLDFYRKHYSANAMRLVVLGAEPLDELEALVAPLFSQVPNHNYQAEQIAVPLFDPERLPMLVTVQPQATLRQLQVSFSVPDVRAAYQAKPMSYLGNLIGHEGEGSLLAEFKRLGLAEGLGAGEGVSWRGGSLFSITITLTEQGVGEYERVLQLLFAYLDVLREAGPQEWLFAEQAELAALSFRFREQGSAIGYVSSLASGMHLYDPEDVLRGPYLMQTFAPNLIAQALDAMRPSQAHIVLTAPGVATQRDSVHYAVPYAVASLQPPAVARLAMAAPPASLHLPQRNEFIAEDLSLVTVADDNPLNPALALDTPRKRIWFRQATEFRIPRGALYVNFRSPLVGQDAAQTAAAVLYTNLLSDRVNDFTYPAMLAGLNFSVYKHAQGISLRMSGYNDKQEALLERLLQVFANPSFDPERFVNIRDDLIRGLQNAVASRPSSQVISDLREAMLWGVYGEEAMIAELQRLDLPALQAYARDFWQQASAEAMLYGNYAPAQVASLESALDLVLRDGEAPSIPQLQVLDLAPGESLLYTTDVPHDDAVVSWYLQGAGDGWEDRAATYLTAQIMKSGFFQQLRTEQQLGYVVGAYAWPQYDVPGLVLLVQSPSHSAAHVAEAMDVFMQQLDGSLSAAQFERHRTALVGEILEPDKNLFERAERYWQAIAKKQYDFDAREQLASAVSALALEDWRRYYTRVFLQQRHSLMVVAPGARGELPALAATRYTSAADIQEGHARYLVN